MRGKNAECIKISHAYFKSLISWLHCAVFFSAIACLACAVKSSTSEVNRSAILVAFSASDPVSAITRRIPLEMASSVTTTNFLAWEISLTWVPPQNSTEVFVAASPAGFEINSSTK